MTLPKSCEVEALAEWMRDVMFPSCAGQPGFGDGWREEARAVRALLEKVALDAATRAKFTTPGNATMQAMGSTALGAERA